MLKEILEEKYLLYNRAEFIKDDPVCIPHMFSQKENIEISGFLVASIAWGRRDLIIKNGIRLVKLLGNDPFDFIRSASEREIKQLNTFTHRTFNSTDLQFFIRSLRNIYQHYHGLESLFLEEYQRSHSLKKALAYFYDIFFELPYPLRTKKHVANVMRGASAKRLNMFLRWMIRKDENGVDFGIWKGIPASALYIPLDLHTGNVSRALGLLHRKSNDWKAVEELTKTLRTFDPKDPVKYDFALFGMGIFENSKTIKF